MIESLPLGWTIATVLAVAVAPTLLRRLLAWRPVCGQPMPREMVDDDRRIKRCRRSPFHQGRHAHGQPFSREEVRW